MSVYLYRLARWAFRRRRLVLALWILAAGTAITLSVVGGGKTDNTFTVPGTESQRATNLLKEKLPALSGGQTQIVFATHGDTKVTDPSYKAGV
ncbi:MMPL family transporter, partial [Streptomyces sp. NPDC057757]